MAKPTQDGRMMAVTSPLGKDALLIETVSGYEEISRLFEYQLEMLAEPETQFNFDALVGQPLCVVLNRNQEAVRYIHGIVSRFVQGDQVSGPRGDVSFLRYRAEIVPKFWMLKRRSQSRIFQSLNVHDILKQVLTGLDVAWQLQGTYEPRDYCSQYRESDFDFASRLMEEEGIFYYFTHSANGHTMVVADTAQSHPGLGTIRYEGMDGGKREDARIQSWEKTQELQSGKYTLWDHCFELTGQNLESKASIQESVAVGTVSHKLKVGGNDSLEVYDYPGGYAQRFDGIAPGGGDRAADVQKIFQDNKRTTGLRMQQEAVNSIVLTGHSDCQQLLAGSKFTLSKHYHADGDYVLTHVSHRCTQAGAYTSGNTEPSYGNSFRAIPFALPFRPQEITPKASVVGTHTATVVGPPGEEIFPDKYSRVKVQFHWDRNGKKDAGSSCWVRVATLWAGQQWGMIHIPRIGQEVVVAFEEGDPDRPIIVGSVYNNEQMPPYALPDNRTKSGVKSRSSLEGKADNFNEIRFEDKKGAEEVYVHAEKDFYRFVENNELVEVGFRQNGEAPDKGDRTVRVFNNEEQRIGIPHPDGTLPYEGNQKIGVWNEQYLVSGVGKTKAETGDQYFFVWNNQFISVGEGKTDCKNGSQQTSVWNNQEILIGTGKGANPDGSQLVTIFKDRTVSLETGNDMMTISKGNRETTLDKGNDKLTLSKGDLEIKLDAGTVKIEAMTAIEMKVGQNSITIDQSGVTIKGIMVTIEGTASAEMKSPMTTVKGDGMLTCKGGVVMIN